MQTSKNKQVVLLLSSFLFLTLIAIYIVYQLTSSGSLFGSPKAAISCSYCDLAFDQNACVANCNAVNNINAGADCPADFTKVSVIRDDATGFVGCKPQQDIACISGTDCIGLISPIAGYTVGCSNAKCMMEPIGNSRYWTGVLPKTSPTNWADCGCGEAADSTVIHRCDATNPSGVLKFSCSVCGQDAAVVCPEKFVAKVDRVFKGNVTCVDNGVAKPVTGVSVELKDSNLKLQNQITSADGSFYFSKVAEPEIGINYSLSVSNIESANPKLTEKNIQALGFVNSNVSDCQGVDAEDSSTKYCNANCSKGTEGNYSECNVGMGESTGYNFSIGKCDTDSQIPVYICYSCDRTSTPQVISNTQISKCDTGTETKEEVEKSCN